MSTTTGFNPITIDDVESSMNCCSDAFGQLAALLLVIKEKAPECSEISKLAALGWSVACDMDNFAGAVLEQMQKGGVTK